MQAAARLLSPAETLLDVGAGIRPQTLIACRRHVCAEPHGPYADVLTAHGYEVIESPAPFVFDAVEADTVCFFDVIEHMERADGLRSLEKARATARQVVVFTPLGFMEQEGDAWGMGGEFWQKHRSGWTPDDFPDWACLVDGKFHEKRGGAFVAIWKR